MNDEDNLNISREAKFLHSRLQRAWLYTDGELYLDSMNLTPHYTFLLDNTGAGVGLVKKPLCELIAISSGYATDDKRKEDVEYIPMAKYTAGRYEFYNVLWIS
jgi:hypothetical protein